jgi:hypothetical protein
MTSPRLGISPESHLLIDVKHGDRIADALEKIAACLASMVNQPDLVKPVDTRCIGHVEGHVTGYHVDGQPKYDAGYRCHAPGTLDDDGVYRCIEHKKIRESHGKGKRR